MIDSFGMAMYLLERVGSENFGLTLDYCHMLMKKENPAYGLSVALEQNKVHAVHLNDGRGTNDDGFMVGAVNIFAMMEFIYYLKKNKYDGMIYFDTFPIRENPEREAEANIKIFKKICRKIDEIGMEHIGDVIAKNDAVAVMDMFSDYMF